MVQLVNNKPTTYDEYWLCWFESMCKKKEKQFDIQLHGNVHFWNWETNRTNRANPIEVRFHLSIVGMTVKREQSVAKPEQRAHGKRLWYSAEVFGLLLVVFQRFGRGNCCVSFATWRNDLCSFVLDSWLAVVPKINATKIVPARKNPKTQRFPFCPNSMKCNCRGFCLCWCCGTTHCFAV